MKAAAVPTEKTPTIFINYRRSDTEHAAKNLFDHLEARFGQDRVFRDRDKIPPGENFRDVIGRNLEDCTDFLVLIGPGWRKTRSGGVPRIMQPDDLVRLEIEAALARPDIRVIPVLMDVPRMPTSSKLPDTLHALCDRHAITIHSDYWDAGIEKLVGAICGPRPPEQVGLFPPDPREAEPAPPPVDPPVPKILPEVPPEPVRAPAERFLEQLEACCSPAAYATVRRLYNWTIERAVEVQYTNGWASTAIPWVITDGKRIRPWSVTATKPLAVCVNFEWITGRGLPVERLDAFLTALEAIPGVKPIVKDIRKAQYRKRTAIPVDPILLRPGAMDAFGVALAALTDTEWSPLSVADRQPILDTVVT